jgi:hypothetical protein
MKALDQLLEADANDPGCDAALEEIDAYCEAVHGGEDAARQFPRYAIHMRHCAACREDTQGLLAVLAQE